MAYQYPVEPGVAMPPIYSGVPMSMGGYQMPAMPAMSGLDHSQGKWFAPGEALPPGFIVTAHPEGHTEPQSHHLMSDMARDSFVITGDAAAKAVKAGSSALKLSKKKSKTKKGSTCC